jgi:hypothetical protein
MIKNRKMMRARGELGNIRVSWIGLALTVLSAVMMQRDLTLALVLLVLGLVDVVLSLIERRVEFVIDKNGIRWCKKAFVSRNEIKSVEFKKDDKILITSVFDDKLILPRTGEMKNEVMKWSSGHRSEMS